MICLSNKNNPVGVETQIGLFILCALAMVLSDEGAKEQQPPAMLVRLKSLD